MRESVRTGWNSLRITVVSKSIVVYFTLVAKILQFQKSPLPTNCQKFSSHLPNPLSESTTISVLIRSSLHTCTWHVFQITISNWVECHDSYLRFYLCSNGDYFDHKLQTISCCNTDQYFQLWMQQTTFNCISNAKIASKVYLCSLHQSSSFQHYSIFNTLPIVRSLHESGPSVFIVLGIYVGAILYQQLNHFGLTRDSCIHERCGAVWSRRVAFVFMLV